MPQVHPVAEVASDPDRNRQRQQASWPRAGAQLQRGHHAGRQQRGDEEADRVPDWVPPADLGDRDLPGDQPQQRERGQAEAARPAAQRLQTRVVGAQPGQDEGEERPDEELVGAGVGAVVDAVRRRGIPEHRPPEHRQHTQHRDPAQHHPRPRVPQQYEQEERPGEIELLLHAQGPGVAERRGEIRVRPGVPGPHEIDDGPRGQRRGHPRPVEQRQLERHGEERGDRTHHQQGRHQAHPPPSVERPQPDPTGTGVLADQQPGDDETADREEHVHAHRTAGHQVRLHVVDDHQHHRDRPQSVQPRDPPTPTQH